MSDTRVLAIAFLGIVLSAPPVVAQTPFGYRDYLLGSSMASVVKTSGARESDMKTVHERPAIIRELTWRAPYVRSGSEFADPVRDVVFSFYDDRLYQVVVTYDRDRTVGLTNDDIVESLSKTYGVPLLRYAKKALTARSDDVPTDTTLIAQWDDDAALLTLTRGTYSTQYQLVLISKALNADARGAIKEALRLDRQEAPQRDRDLRDKGVAEARAASEKARTLNKPAFRP